MKNLPKRAAMLLALTFSFALLAGCAGASRSSVSESSELEDQTDPVSSGASSDGGDSAIVPEAPSDSSSSDSSDPPDSSAEPEPEPEPEPDPEPEKVYASYIRCTGENVNLRAGAGTNYAVVGTAAKDTMYVVAGKSGDWYKTYYKNQTVYISASYVTTFSIEKSENEKVEDVVWEAYKELGVPYVYGAVRLHDGYGNFLSGFTKMKFDCSSLVQYAFFEGAGVLLQTTTRLQVRQGTYVPREQLRRGDCIYFTNSSRENNTGIERVGHVAIYLGDDYILHTSSDYARIEKMTAQRWAYYIEARRFV